MSASPSQARSPLRGAGILITRPARQAGAFAEKVAAVGGRPLVFPAIVILPPTDPDALLHVHAALADYDYAVFVSANAAEFGVPDPRRWPAHVIAFAPGPGTAEALHALGIANVQVPRDRQDSEGLLALPPFMHPAGKRIIVFRGEGGRELLGETLRARGAHVDHVACYRRATPDDGAGLAYVFAEQRVDAVTVTSSEGVDNLWAIADERTRTRWAGVPTFAPHERIAARARAHGLLTVATGAGDAGLLAGLLEWFGDRAP